LNALVGPTSGALLRKEKDETSPPKLFLGGSLNLPPFLVCEVGGFFIFKTLPASRWSLNQNRSALKNRGTKLKD
jgi:hypothetical protein